MSQASTTCVYSHGSPTQQFCNVTCNVFNAAANPDGTNQLAGIAVNETGTLSVTGSHMVAQGWQSGQSTATNAGTTCTGNLGGGAVRCSPFTIGCNINLGWNGVAFTVSSSNGDVVWASTNAVPNTCGAIADPQNQAPPPNTGCTGGGRKTTFTDGGTGGDGGTCSVTPIIIDVEGEGFHLTNAANGVVFDIAGDGHPIKMAWTNPSFHNAFLALDRNHNGVIDNGTELFGNFSPQPGSPNPNGFLALAEFDKPENGGNGDGIIDARDSIYQQLILWIDENHDGISQPRELRKLTEFGIYSISLSYFESQRQDDFGNQFRYKARINAGQQRDRRDETPSGEPGRWIYDIFLVTN